MTSEIRKYDFIDAMRGIAILGVLAVHSSQLVGGKSHCLRWVMSMGASGVQLFYIASALTLCMSWESRAGKESAPVRNFYVRRLFRIAPLFWLAVLLYPLLMTDLLPVYWAPNGIKWWFFPVTALFLHGLHPETINSVVPYGWSIAVEMGFYIIFPLLISKIKSVKANFVFLALSLVIYNLMVFGVQKVFLPLYPPEQRYLVLDFMSLNFLGQLPVFATGILAFFGMRPQKRGTKWLVYGGLTAFVIEVGLFLLSPSKPRIVSTQCLFGMMFAALALILAKYPIRVLVNPITTTIGKYSFGMYLTHFAVLHCVAGLNMRLFQIRNDIACLTHFVVVSVITFVISMLVYIIIENPMIDVGKRLIAQSESKKRIG